MSRPRGEQSAVPASKPATGGPSYPYTIHRHYLCGHPHEYIRVSKIPEAIPSRLIHTIIAPPAIKEGVTAHPYRQTCERCPSCAATHRTAKASKNPQEKFPPSLAAHQGEVRGGDGWKKDGFLHVQRRERFFGRGKDPVRWLKECEHESGNHRYMLLKELHEAVERARDVRPHAGIPLEDRVGKRKVEGPKWKGEGMVAYVVQTAVDGSLAEGLGHDVFDEDDRGGPQLPSRRPSVRAPRAARRIFPNSGDERTNSQLRQQDLLPQVPRSPRDVQGELRQTRSRANTHDRGPQPDRQNIPPPQPSSPTLPTTRPTINQLNTLKTSQDEEIARHRALALRCLEGAVPTTGERYSDSTVPPQRQATPQHIPWPTSSPTPTSHQRPFGPTHGSGTTLSYGDLPRHSPSPEPDSPGDSIDTILDTLYGPPRPSEAQEV